MSENSILSQLSLISWLGPTRHPPRSLLRAVLVLVDLQDLRLFARETLGTNIMDMTTHDRVPYHFSRTDERSFFTFAHYVEPMTSIAVYIHDLQNAISARIHHTWGIRIPTRTLQLWYEDPSGYHHRLDTEHSLHQILNAYHPTWYRSHITLFDDPARFSPFCPFVLRLSCCA